MTAFETYVQTELPKRAVMIRGSDKGYSGDPNAAVDAEINNSPIGTWFLDDDGAKDLWQKDKATSTGWTLKSPNLQFGNLSLIPDVIGGLGLALFIDGAAGDDDNDGLTAGTAFATAERALREIPNSEQVDGDFPFVVLQFIGVGPYIMPTSVSLERCRNLAIYIQGDVSAPSETFTIPSWSAVAGKKAIWEASVGVYSTVPTDSSHVLIQAFSFGGFDFLQPLVLDGVGCVPGAGTIRSVSSSTPFVTGTVTLCPFVTKFVENAGTILKIGVTNPNVTISVVAVNVEATAGGFNPIRVGAGYNLRGCLVRSTGVIQINSGEAAIGASVWMGEVQTYSAPKKPAVSSVPIGGLILDGPGSTKGHLFAVDGDIRPQGLVVRGTSTSGLLQFGVGSAIPNYITGTLQSVDLEPALSPREGIVAERGTQLSVVGGVTFSTNINRAAILRTAYLQFSGAGSFAGSCKAPIHVKDGSLALDLKTKATGLANTATPGDDVEVGTASPQTFASLPVTELTELSRAT